jgi:hypothetical protein
MSSGVFRQYNAPRLPPPRVIIAQTLDAPIGNAIVQAQRRESFVTRLVPVGIAALIPVAAVFVPQRVVAQVRRADYAAQPVPPEQVAIYLSQVGPDAPLPFSAVETVERAAYPTQELPSGIAALLPVAQTFTPPSQVATASRSPGQALQLPPEGIAPFQISNTTDTPLAASLARIQVATPPAIYQSSPGVAATLPIVASFVPPFQTPVLRAPPAATNQPTPSIAPLISAVAEFVPPLALPRIYIELRAQSLAPSRTIQSVAITPVAKWTMPLPHRLPYPTQLLPMWLVQQVVAPTSDIDDTRLLRVSFNGRTLAAGELGQELNVDYQPRTIH